MPEYPKPNLTVDCIVHCPTENKVLLIRRGKEPFKGRHALPGGFVNENEPLQKAALRELEEETGLDISKLHLAIQVGAFGDPGRDPRGWTVSVAYLIHVEECFEVKGQDDAESAEWVDVEAALNGELAFDHHVILVKALADFGGLPS